jgi:hypothetical protein
MAEGPFNPLDKVNLGRSVAEAMLERDPVPLGNLSRFNGAGIYALYYTGKFSSYAPLAKPQGDKQYRQPIYVGKAVSPGARKGNFGVEASVGPDLWKRLQEHAESIRQTDLRVEDFLCRHLVVDDIWIPLGEALLIAKFMPLWNRLIDGFGNHDPGAGRYGGLRPRWDVLHPGRAWAHKCQERSETAEQISREVENYLATAPKPEGHMLNPDKDKK